MWRVRYASGGASLAVTQAGDYNDDGRVDAADYVVWRQLRAAGGYDPSADGDTNGVIDGADFLVWRANFVRRRSKWSGNRFDDAAGAQPATIGSFFVILATICAAVTVASSRALRLPTGGTSRYMAIGGPVHDQKTVISRSISGPASIARAISERAGC